MHGHVDPIEFLHQISTFLGGYYLLLAVMNGVAAFMLWEWGPNPVIGRVPVPGMGREPVKITASFGWLAVSLLFLLMSPIAFSGYPEWMAWISIPQSIRNGINFLLSGAIGPVVYSVGSLVLLAVMYIFRGFFVRPAVAWGLLNISLLLMGLSLTDANFAAIVTKPDNVPIVGLVFLLGFFTWLGTKKAVENDDRMERGLPPQEAEDKEKVLVWPDLVYTELICMVALTALLLIWAIALKAPLEEPASSVKTPNPSKAPWYFLGLQEMLVYFDPWMAGVVLPSLVVFGLMAIPYIDFNKAGNGYYTINQRKFAYLTFQFGFLVMWVTLIVLGTFLRGPNWNFFGPYEQWDVHKVEALTNVDLSQYFWIYLLGTGLPKAPDDAGLAMQLGYIVVREWLGIVLVLGYFLALPPLLAMVSGFFSKMFVRMGFIRYMVMLNLLLFMASLPIKMLLRWTVNLKYIIAIPEFFFNF